MTERVRRRTKGTTYPPLAVWSAVQAVAKRTGYSSAYFSCIFKDFVGVTFPDYLNYRRIAEYDRLKRENPELSTGKLARMCGFTSMNTFYRAYHKFNETED